MKTANSIVCPLCLSHKIEEYFSDRKRHYLQCRHCLLVFVPEHYHLSEESEKSEYDKHDNQVDDFHYRKFLSRLVNPLSKRLGKSAIGLDFGCGDGPALIAMMQEQGFTMKGFDIYYRNTPEVFNNRYDFVTLTEVVEHLAQPMQVLQRIWLLLNDHGKLGIMTKLVIDKDAFSRWHYKNDPTHIIFFSTETMNFLATTLHASLERVATDAFILTKLKP